MRQKSRRVGIYLVVVVSILLAASLPVAAHTATDYYKQRWLTDLSVDFRFTSSFPASFHQQVRLGANQWNSVNTTMTYAEKAAVSDFDPKVCPSSYQYNGFHWRNIDGSVSSGGTILAQTRFCVYSYSVVLAALPREMHSMQITYDQDESWFASTGDAPLGTYDVWSTASHELGHGTGWSGHLSGSICDDNSAQQTMCAFISDGTERQRTLEDHDIHTFRGQYGVAPA